MHFLILPLAGLATMASASALAGAPLPPHPPADPSVGPTVDHVHNPYIECTVRRQGRHLRINQCCCTNPDGHPACRPTWGAAYAMCSGGQTPSSAPSVKTEIVNTTVTVMLTPTAVPRAIDEETNTAEPYMPIAENRWAYGSTAWMIGEKDKDGKLVTRALTPEEVAEVMAAEEPEKRQWHQWGGLVEIRPGFAAPPVTSAPEPSTSKAPLLQPHWHFGPPRSLPHGRLPKTTSTDSPPTPKATTTEQIAVRTPEGPTPDRSHWHDYLTQESIVTFDSSGHLVTPSSTASSSTTCTSDEAKSKSKSKSTHTTQHTPPWALPHGRLPITTSTSTTSSTPKAMNAAEMEARAADAPPRDHNGCHIQHGLWECPPSASEQPTRKPWHGEHSWLVTEPSRTHTHWHGAHSWLATTSTPTPGTLMAEVRAVEGPTRDHAGCHIQHGLWECPPSASDEPAHTPTPWHDEHGPPVLTHHASDPLAPLSAAPSSPTPSTFKTLTASHRLHSERIRAARAFADHEPNAASARAFEDYDLDSASTSTRLLPSAHPSLADSGTAPAAPTSLVRPDAHGYLYNPDTGHHIDLPHPAFPEYEDPNHTHPVHVTHHADGRVTTAPLEMHPGGAAGHHGPNATSLLKYKNHPDPDAKPGWAPTKPHAVHATYWHIHCEGSGYDALLPDITHLLGCFYSQSEADRTGRFICGQEEIYIDLDLWSNVDECVLGCQRCMEKYAPEKRERMLCNYHMDLGRCAAGWWSSKGNDTMVDEGIKWTLRHNSWAKTAGDDYDDPQVVPNWGHSAGDDIGQSTQNRVNKLHDGPDREVAVTDPRVMPMPTVQTVGPIH